MSELGITDTLTSDHHFEQAGFRVLLKDQGQESLGTQRRISKSAHDGKSIFLST
jgi:hypothetical protein